MESLIAAVTRSGNAEPPGQASPRAQPGPSPIIARRSPDGSAAGKRSGVCLLDQTHTPKAHPTRTIWIAATVIVTATSRPMTRSKVHAQRPRPEPTRRLGTASSPRPLDVRALGEQPLRLECRPEFGRNLGREPSDYLFQFGLVPRSGNDRRNEPIRKRELKRSGGEGQ